MSNCFKSRKTILACSLVHNSNIFCSMCKITNDVIVLLSANTLVSKPSQPMTVIFSRVKAPSKLENLSFTNDKKIILAQEGDDNKALNDDFEGVQRFENTFQKTNLTIRRDSKRASSACNFQSSRPLQLKLLF